jgi:hypothetical protein
MHPPPTNSFWENPAKSSNTKNTQLDMQTFFFLTSSLSRYCTCHLLLLLFLCLKVFGIREVSFIDGIFLLGRTAMAAQKFWGRKNSNNFDVFFLGTLGILEEA